MKTLDSRRRKNENTVSQFPLRPGAGTQPTICDAQLIQFGFNAVMV